MQTELSCDLKLPNEKPFTVGSEAVLNCTGEIKDFAGKLAELKFLGSEKPEISKYVLKIIRIEKSADGEFQAVVTSYKAGAYQAASFQLQVGEEVHLLKPLNFNVESVLKKSEPAPSQPAPANGSEQGADTQTANAADTQAAAAQASAEPTPIPNYGASKVGLSWYYWVLCFAMVIAFGFMIYQQVRRSLQKRKLIRSLKNYQTALSPINQFYKDIRSLEKKSSLKQVNCQEMFVELENIFNLFLIRSFAVPALQWNSKLIISELKKTYPKMVNEWGQELIVFRREVYSVRTLKVTDQELAVKSLFDSCRSLVEGLDSHHKLRKEKSA